MLKRRLITVSLLLVAAATAVLAIPGLHAAARRASSVSSGWLIAAVGLEVASCVSFLAIFRRFFDELQGREARRLAWIETGCSS